MAHWQRGRNVHNVDRKLLFIKKDVSSVRTAEHHAVDNSQISNFKMAVSSSIKIHNLRLYAYHGVKPMEQKVGGEFSVSVEVWTPLEKAANSDMVAHTVNYAELCQIVVREMKQPSKLLENAAWRIAQAIMNEYDEISAVEVQLIKLNPPMGVQCDGAGVCIKLDRN